MESRLKDGIRILRRLYLQLIAAFLILLTLLVVYGQDLSILFGESFQSDVGGHIVLIPFLFLYLLYQKREHVKASLQLQRVQRKTTSVSASDFVGAALCLAAFLLYWYGSYTFYQLEHHVASLLIFIVGVTLILTGTKTLRILIFPISFLVFLAPPPSIATYTAGGLLASVNTQGSYVLLKTLGLPVSLSYSYGAPIIALNTTAGPIEFAVYQASSGLNSLVAFSMFATFLVYITHGSVAKKITLFALGLLILPILNITRISIIVSAAHWLGEEIAMNVFHTFAGWFLIFGGMLLLLLIGEKVLHLPIMQNPRKRSSSCSECDANSIKQEPFCLNCGKFLKRTRLKMSRTLWLKLAVLLIASSLVTVSIQAPVFSYASGLTLTNSEPQVSTSIFPNVTDYQMQFLYRDSAYEKIARQDANFVYAYLPRNDSELPIYVIVGVSDSVMNLHNWEVSLVAYRIAQGLPPLASVIALGETQLVENPPITAQYIVFQHNDQSTQSLSKYTYVALYWYLKASFRNGLTIVPKYVRINLLILTQNADNYPRLMKELESIGRSIALSWEPLKVRSFASLGVMMQQILLVLAVLAAVFIEASHYVLKQRKKGINSKIFEKLASTEEKRLHQTIRELSQKTKEITTQEIASAVAKATRREVKLNELVDELKNLERHGLLRKDMMIIGDVPTLVWKP